MHCVRVRAHWFAELVTVLAVLNAQLAMVPDRGRYAVAVTEPALPIVPAAAAAEKYAAPHAMLAMERSSVCVMFAREMDAVDE